MRRSFSFSQCQMALQAPKGLDMLLHGFSLTALVADIQFASAGCACLVCNQQDRHGVLGSLAHHRAQNHHVAVMLVPDSRLSVDCSYSIWRLSWAVAFLLARPVEAGIALHVQPTLANLLPA